MRSIVTNAAAVTVLPPIDKTKTFARRGRYSTGATVIQAKRGKPHEILRITAQNFQRVLGTAWHPSIGAKHEGMRHLHDALQACPVVNVVRVVGEGAKFPAIALRKLGTPEAWAEATAYTVGDVITVTGGTLICVVAHTSDTTAPTLASHGTNWAQEKGAWQYSTTQVPVAYALNDIVTVDDGKLICTAAHTSGDANDVDPPRCDAPLDGFAVSESLTAAWAPWNHRVEKKTFDFVDESGSPITPTIDETDELILFWVLDGDDSENRRIEITDVDYARKRFNLTFYDKDELGHSYILEGPYQCGLKVDDLDDMERPCFIETVLQGQSNIFRCQVNPDIVFSDMLYRSQTYFTGGTAGAEPTAAQYKGAWNIFRDEQTTAHLMFAAGCFTQGALLEGWKAVLANCIEIAELRHASFFFDCPATYSPKYAQKWLRDTATNVRLFLSRQAQVYYSPYKAADPFYSGFATWGASGEAVAACSRGNARNTGQVPGVHYSPAGVKRATLSRKAVQPLYPHEQINREVFYRERINPVIIHEQSNRLIIDDALTRVFTTSYQRFTHVNRIANYIDHEFYRGAQRIKHDPDGVTERSLNKLMKSILNGLVMSEALVPPREAGQGQDPYTIKITQQDFDLWQVDWAFCPTGSARRIVGQPIILR